MTGSVAAQYRYCITPGCVGKVSIHIASSLCRKCREMGRPEAPDTVAAEARGQMIRDENGRVVDASRLVMRWMKR